MASGEDTSTQRRRRTRTDDREEASKLIGYEDEAGEVIAVTGDEDSMYTGPLGRASSDGVLGLNTQPDGATQRFALDSLGHLWVRIADPTPGDAPSRYTSAAQESSRVIKPSAGVVLRVGLLTTAGLASDVILMIFDSAVAPVNGAAPIWRALLNAPGGGAIGEVSDGFEGEEPLACTNGIAVATSSTLATLTLTSVGFFQVLYE